MRVYMDWEFLEDGFTIKPISVGMVSENGQELYFEFMNAPWRDIYAHPWLKENVVPHLHCAKTGGLVNMISDNIFKSKLSIKSRVYEFLQQMQAVDGELQLWGWYSSYDHVCLAQLFGRMIDLPEFVPMWTNDLRQEFHRLGNPSYPRQTEGLHNALEDARHIKQKHEWLMRYERGGKLRDRETISASPNPEFWRQ